MGGAPGGETPRVADSSAAGASRFFHNSVVGSSVGATRIKKLLFFGPGKCPIDPFGPVANRTVLGRLLVAILVCLRRAPHSSACRAWAALRGGPRCPHSAEDCPRHRPNGLRRRRRRDDAPAARAVPLPTNRNRGTCSRSRHDASAAARRPQEVPAPGLVIRITEIARRRRGVARRSARWY